MKELMKKLDKRIKVISYENVDDVWTVYLKSINKSAICPCCGKKSSKVNAKYFRTIKDLPIQKNKVILKLETKTFFCKNQECKTNTFSEKFNFIENHSRMTTRLKESILEVSKGMSAKSSKTVINKELANISDDTILRILKKNNSDSE